jgi:hypothetical protein
MFNLSIIDEDINLGWIGSGSNPSGQPPPNEFILTHNFLFPVDSGVFERYAEGRKT